jgi:hypothetical protein
LRGIPLRVRILLKKSPHPNLLPEPYMAQEKELSILISLPIDDYFLIYANHPL